jgi:hypothetical protein
MNMNKVLSGRFWLTIISGYVFAYCAVKGVLSSEAVSAIVSSVFVSYFQRTDRAVQEPSQRVE